MTEKHTGKRRWPSGDSLASALFLIILCHLFWLTLFVSFCLILVCSSGLVNILEEAQLCSVINYLLYDNHKQKSHKMCPEFRIRFGYCLLVVISVASPTSVAKLSTPCMDLWFSVAFFPISLWTLGLGAVTVHTCALTGQWEQRGQPAGLSGTCLPPRVPLKDTETIGVRWSRTASVSSHCHFEQQSLKQALMPTCKEWSGSFCFSPWQHVQMGTCHWAIVLLSLLRDSPDLKPVVLHDWKSAVVLFAVKLTISFWGFDKENCGSG